jgi:hypothetical protein
MTMAQNMIHPVSQRNENMQRVSVRTLALLVELLIAVVVHQYLAAAKAPRPDAVWLADNTVIQQTTSVYTDCNL